MTTPRETIARHQIVIRRRDGTGRGRSIGPKDAAKILAALAAAGFAVVPVEPTREMILAVGWTEENYTNLVRASQKDTL